MFNVITSELYKIIRSKVFYGVVIIFLIMSLFSAFSGVKEKLIPSSSDAVNESLKTGISIFQSSYTVDGFLYAVIITSCHTLLLSHRRYMLRLYEDCQTIQECGYLPLCCLS